MIDRTSGLQIGDWYIRQSFFLRIGQFFLGKQEPREPRPTLVFHYYIFERLFSCSELWDSALMEAGRVHWVHGPCLGWCSATRYIGAGDMRTECGAGGPIAGWHMVSWHASSNCIGGLSTWKLSVPCSRIVGGKGWIQSSGCCLIKRGGGPARQRW